MCRQNGKYIKGLRIDEIRAYKNITKIGHSLIQNELLNLRGNNRRHIVGREIFKLHKYRDQRDG